MNSKQNMNTPQKIRLQSLTSKYYPQMPQEEQDMYLNFIPPNEWEQLLSQRYMNITFTKDVYTFKELFNLIKQNNPSLEPQLKKVKKWFKVIKKIVSNPDVLDEGKHSTL